ncbi:MAG: hypothetical protein M9938_00725 [Solirubrobacterales bacterium]|nr:hypothetical protein [Solirubrobacterales bacterium]
MKSIRIDRERAIRTAALAALILLTVTFLPDLLRRPKPPPVPANVGFTASESDRFRQPGLPTGPIAPPDPRQTEADRPDRVRPKRRRGRPERSDRESSRDRKTETRRRKKSRWRSSRPDRDPAPNQGGAPTGPPAAASSPPVPAPVYSPPPPPPDPPPPDPPGDGSEEFAPR